MNADQAISSRRALETDEVTRYARHLLLPGVGRAGQERLASARVLVVGAGGLGSPVLLYLAAAGVGTLGIVDDDLVELTNLQRQVVHETADIGRAKVDSAADRVRALNPAIQVRAHRGRLTAQNAAQVLGDYDLVIDGADNFPTRYVVAAAAARHGIPHVWGSVYRFEGQVSVWSPPQGPCYACVFPEPPSADQAPSCSIGGVFGAVCAALGSVMATEAIKLLTGIGEPLIGRLLMHDALAMRWSELPVRRHPDCPVCRVPESARAPSPAPVVEPEAVESVAVSEIERELGEGALLVDVREQGERDIVVIPGAQWVTLDVIRRGAEDLPTGARVLVHCKSGARSAEAVRLLRARGVDAVNITGGVLAWIREIDPTLPTY